MGRTLHCRRRDDGTLHTKCLHQSLVHSGDTVDVCYLIRGEKSTYTWVTWVVGLRTQTVAQTLVCRAKNTSSWCIAIVEAMGAYEACGGEGGQFPRKL